MESVDFFLNDSYHDFVEIGYGSVVGEYFIPKDYDNVRDDSGGFEQWCKGSLR